MSRRIKYNKVLIILTVAILVMFSMAGCTKAKKAQLNESANKVANNSLFKITLYQSFSDKCFTFCVDKEYNYYVIDLTTDKKDGTQNWRIVETVKLNDSQIKTAKNLMNSIDNYKFGNGDGSMDGLRLDMFHNSNEVHTEYNYMADFKAKGLVKEFVSYSTKQNVIK